MFSVGSGTDRGPISELPTIDLSRHTELTKTIRGMKNVGHPVDPKDHSSIGSLIPYAQCMEYLIFTNIYP
jgi:prolyl oligopeptidase PreP (S9A serine peptidase family)